MKMCDFSPENPLISSLKIKPFVITVTKTKFFC